MLDAKNITSIMLNVIFVASFLGVFFFTYAAKVEEEVVQEQVDYLVKDMTSNLQLLPDDALEAIRIQVKNIQKPDMSELDNKVKENNKKVFEQAMTLIGITLAVGLYIAYRVSNKYNFSLKDLIKENSIILFFIGTTELFFLNVFGRHYLSIDPNMVKLGVLNKLTNL
uniref:Uncharacterized protein n=1 Tax=viral metagenome TaxID=1070528 RepID=A0A6C0ECT3_9ZZZZ